MPLFSFWKDKAKLDLSDAEAQNTPMVTATDLSTIEVLL